MPAAPRSSDELILEWIALRKEGVQAGKIAALYGVKSARVRSQTNLVKNVDMEMHGDDGGDHYWSD